MSIRYSIKEMQGIARHYKGKCLSKEYIDLYSPLNWMCEKGHTWESSYSIVRQGGWCRQCLIQNDKNEKLKELLRIAKERGGECLSTDYIDNKTKLQWQCKKGHVWMSTPKDVKNAGNWCLICSGNAKRTIAEMKSLAVSKGGKCLSLKYINNKTPLLWQCGKGHKWKTTPKVIITKDAWCPYCAGKALHTIEDGRRLARQHGGKCLTASYENSKMPLQWQCMKGHTWKASYNSVNSGSWCSICAHKRTAEKLRTDIIEFRKLAMSRGGKLVSKEFRNVHIPVQWQCAKGHIWNASIQNVRKHGSWCPNCAR